MAFIIFLLFSLFLQGALAGEVVCEEMPVEMCSFSIASSGKRCVLENYESGEGMTGFQCITSEVVVVENLAEWIEKDECISACGVDRKSVGISSDSLLDPQFTANLCSAACYHNCPNIIDLYNSLAIGEGIHLSDLCNNMARRGMGQLLSSGAQPLVQYLDQVHMVRLLVLTNRWLHLLLHPCNIASLSVILRSCFGL